MTERAAVDTSAIPGWGIDADPQNNPTYPMRDITKQRDRGLSWTRPEQQKPNVEILRSIEYNRLPAVLGTSTPPSGVSGMIRRIAFRRSESDWWHWLMLMGADRVNVVEGVLEDLLHGRKPNVPVKMGMRSESQHNRSGVSKKVGITVAFSAIIYLIVQSRGQRSRAQVQTTVRRG